jgi:hypothetical protein
MKCLSGRINPYFEVVCAFLLYSLLSREDFWLVFWFNLSFENE